MGIRNRYRGLVRSTYLPIAGSDSRPFVMSGTCVWCGEPSSDGGTFCTDECRSQYLVRAIPEELRKAVRERDCGVCEICGREDMHYAITNKFITSTGGGACGVEEVVTLCSQCVDGHNSLEIPTQMPSIVEMTCRPLWKGIAKRHRKWRHLIAPVIYSNQRWTQILGDYQRGNLHVGRQASYRTHEHSKLCRLSKRWWSVWFADRKRDKTIEDVVSMTIQDLDAQLLSASLWIAYFRRRSDGYLE